MPCPTKVRRPVSSKPRPGSASSGNAAIITPYSLPSDGERDPIFRPSMLRCLPPGPPWRRSGTAARDARKRRLVPRYRQRIDKRRGNRVGCAVAGAGEPAANSLRPFYPAIDERKRRLSLRNRWKSSTSSPPAPVGDWTGEIGQKACRGCPSFPSEKVCPARKLWMSNGLDAAGIEGCHSSCSLSFYEGVARELGQRLTTSRGCRVPKPAAFRRTTCLSHTISQNLPTPVEKIPAFVSTGKIAAINVAVLSQRENLPNYTSGYPRAVPFATHSPRRGTPSAIQ